MKGENTGQNIGELTGSWGSRIFLPPSGGLLPNGDMNWANPDLNLLTPWSPQSYSNTSNINEQFRVIDGSEFNALQFTTVDDISLTNSLFLDIGNRTVDCLDCSNVTFRNNKVLEGSVNPATPQYEGQTIWLYNHRGGAWVTNNWFENITSGMTAQASGGTDNYVFNSNFVKNPQGQRQSNGQMAALNWCKNMGGVRINYNTCIAEIGVSNVEDWWSPFSSSGFASDQMEIAYNHIKGGGPSVSGGGLMLGDSQTRQLYDATRYQWVHHNRVLDPGQYGIAIAGGTYQTVEDNEVFAGKYAASASWANVGFYLWRQDITAGEMHSCTVQNNKFLWWGERNSPGTPTLQGVWVPNYGTEWDGNAWINTQPNHGTLAQGNVMPAGWNTNDFNYAPWNVDNEGTSGYDLLPVRTTWAETYIAP